MKTSELIAELRTGDQCRHKAYDGKHHGDLWLRDGDTLLQAADRLEAIVKAWEMYIHAPSGGSICGDDLQDVAHAILGTKGNDK